MRTLNLVLNTPAISINERPHNSLLFSILHPLQLWWNLQNDKGGHLMEEEEDEEKLINNYTQQAL